VHVANSQIKGTGYDEALRIIDVGLGHNVILISYLVYQWQL